MGPAEEEREFPFIISTPSHDAANHAHTRTLVRQHVMRTSWNKNKHHSRAHKMQGDVLAEFLVRRDSEMRKKRRKEDRDNESPISSMGSPSNAALFLGASRPDPFGRYPIPMGSKEHDIIYHIWGSRLVVFQLWRDYWFPLGMKDPAAMHLLIANAAVHRKSLRTSQEDDMLALTHSAAAIHIINERLADPDVSITDDTLGAISGLLAHEFISLRFDQLTIHLDAFQRITELRGGLHKSSMALRMTIFWIEHNICACRDTIPRFPPPSDLIHRSYSAPLRIDGLAHRDKTMARISISFIPSTTVYDILTELSILTMSLRQTSAAQISQENPNFLGFACYTELYKLLALQTYPVDNPVANLVQELFRLGALIFLIEIRRNLGVSPTMTSVQISKLRALFITNELMDQVPECLRIWVLIMAGCSTNMNEDYMWIVRALMSVRKTLSWEDIHDIVSDTWWIEDIFTVGACKLQAAYENAINERWIY